MKNTNSVSICIPTYKRNTDLHNALTSIAQQQYDDSIQVQVVVSDNDPENKLPTKTRKLMKKMEVIYKRNNRNIGFEKNLLQLVQMATGEVLFILTDDDLLEPSAIQKIHEIFVDPSVLYLFSSSAIVNNGQVMRDEEIFPYQCNVVPTDEERIAKLFKHSYVLTGLCFRRSSMRIRDLKRHLGSSAPQMSLMLGVMMRGKGKYITQVLTKHTVCNEVFWLSDENYLIAKRLETLAGHSVNAALEKKIRAEIMKDVPYLLYCNIPKPRKMLLFVKSLVYSCDLTFSDVLTFAIGSYELIVKKAANYFLKKNFF